MSRIIFAFALLFFAGAALAEQGSVTFDGERYEKATENSEADARVVFFTQIGKPGREISFRYYFGASDPMQLATGMAKRLQERYGANFRFALTKKTDANEVMLDYLLPLGQRAEFDALKFVPAQGKGVLALRYRRVLDEDEMNAEAVRALRQRALAELAKFDVSQGNDYFGKR